jgi:hypothetical protein
MCIIGHAVAEAVMGFPPWLTGFKSRSDLVGFVVDKADWGRFSPSTLVSPASHSTDCFTLIIVIHLGLA